MILIAYDGSNDAKQAVQSAAKLFPKSDVTIVTVWHRLLDTLAYAGMDMGVVVDYDQVDDATKNRAQETASEGVELAAGAGLKAGAEAVVVETTVAEAILSAASELDADAVVLGSRGRSGVRSLVLGSVSHQVLHHADRPVLIVPSPEVVAERASHLES